MLFHRSSVSSFVSFWFTTIISIICRIPYLHTHVRRCYNTNNDTDDISRAPSVFAPTASPSPITINLPPPPSTTDDNDDDVDTTTTNTPMNILILFGDDWRYNSIGIMNPLIHTPTLNTLAQNGIHFTNTFVTTSVCWVSRATYFTGQYMSRHQTTRVVDPKFYSIWNTTSWPAVLQQSQSSSSSSSSSQSSSNPYYVGHIGKWQFHNPNQFVQSTLFNFTSIFEYHVNQQTGIRGTEQTINDTIRFFNEYDKIKNQLSTKNTTNGKKQYRHHHPFALNIAMFPPKAEMDSTIPSQNYVTRDLEYNLYKHKTIPIVTNNINDTSYHRLPYFLQNNNPITEARRRYEATYIPNSSYQENMQRYYALITEVDTALQKIIDLLKERNYYNNTVIIFTTDNGFLHGEHGLSGKWYPYQESIRVPLIISDPRMTISQRNTKNHDFIFNIDLAPTILSIANKSIPLQMQGMDITQLYLSRSNGTNTTSNTTGTITSTQIPPPPPPPPAKTTKWRTPELYYEHPTIQSRTYLTSSTAYITLNYSYMIYPEWNNTEVLYDLMNDPNEQYNVIQLPQYRNLVQYVRQRHAYWKEKVK